MPSNDSTANGTSSSSSTAPSSHKPLNILFVCLGNICRSPMAEAIFTTHASSHPLIGTIDSAGTGAYHAGDPPDPRTISTLEDNGIVAYEHAARKVRDSDFENFDLLLGMDAENYADLVDLRGRYLRRKKGVDGGKVAEVGMFGEERFGGKVSKGRRRGYCEKGEEVGDPYYGGTEGFTIAYEQCTRFSKGLVKWVESQEG